MKRLVLFVILSFISCGPQVQVLKETSDIEAWSASASEPEGGGNLKIVVFDVGEGSSTLVVAPDGGAALIDTGPAGSWEVKIKPCLDENGRVDLKYLIITHGDNDHDGDVSKVPIAPLDIKAGDMITLGDVEMNVIAKDCIYSDGTTIDCEAADDNAHSAVILIEYDGFRYLAMGDLPGGGGNPPYDTIDLETRAAELAGDIDVLQAGHHGSNTSTNQNLLDITAPEAAIVSVGNNNDYWHPHVSTIERLLTAGVRIFQTETGWLKNKFDDDVNVINGNITVEVRDGEFSIK
jgi:beta-lactamase superfamily II metal-dependent hydrolase